MAARMSAAGNAAAGGAGWGSERMNYCTALELQTLAVWGQLATMRLCWHEAGLVPLTPCDKEHLLDVAAEGIAACQILWEAGIRFSFTRPVSEEEAVGRPGWNPAQRETRTT